MVILQNKMEQICLIGKNYQFRKCVVRSPLYFSLCVSIFAYTTQYDTPVSLSMSLHPRSRKLIGRDVVSALSCLSSPLRAQIAMLLLPSVRHSSRGHGDRRGQLLPVQLRRPEQNARLGGDRSRLCDLPRWRWRDTVLRRARLYEEKGLSLSTRFISSIVR